jgi:hypothetical protein
MIWSSIVKYDVDDSRCVIMPQLFFRKCLFLTAALVSLESAAFRSCELTDSEAYLAMTQYRVAELSFDLVSGQVSGTETTYNHANTRVHGSAECHVTYEFAGVIEPVSGVVLLNGQRTNHSVSCEPEVLVAAYPLQRTDNLLIEFADSGRVEVMLADSGERFASGEWTQGVAAYRTEEVCTIF